MNPNAARLMAAAQEWALRRDDSSWRALATAAEDFAKWRRKNRAARDRWKEKHRLKKAAHT